VIPQLGGLLGAIPIVLVALARQGEPEVALALLAVYLVAVQVVKLAVGGRLGRDLNVRPAIALPAFAVISQIGLVWLLLSAPILVIARNTVRYLRGRVSEPPQPAGVVPGERRRQPAPSGPNAVPVPSVYRDRVAPPPTASAGRPATSRPQPSPGGRTS
jgi:hypothetical protein